MRKQTERFLQELEQLLRDAGKKGKILVAGEHLEIHAKRLHGNKRLDIKISLHQQSRLIPGYRVTAKQWKEILAFPLSESQLKAVRLLRSRNNKPISKSELDEQISGLHEPYVLCNAVNRVCLVLKSRIRLASEWNKDLKEMVLYIGIMPKFD